MKYLNYIFSGFLLFTTLPGAAETGRDVAVQVNGQAAGSLSAVMQGSVVYVPVADLAGILGLRYHESPVKKKVVLTLGRHEILLTRRNPFILVDKKAMQMPSPPLDVDGKMAVPLSFFLYASKHIYSQKVQYDPSRCLLEILPGLHNITGVQIEPLSNGTLIRIKTTQVFPLENLSLSINRKSLNLTVLGASLDSTQIASKEPAGIVRQIVPYVFNKSVQLSFLLSQSIDHKEITTHPGEILISLRTSGRIDPSPNHNSDEDKKRWLIDTIVLDPGHGGHDPGALGKTCKEKDITLQIAKYLRDYLKREMPDVKILMTRDTDILPSLKARTKFANDQNAKLFISIHANANPSSKIRGFETYFLGRARSQMAMEVVQKENSAVQFENDPDAYKEFEGVDFILKAIAANIYMKESEHLAAMVNESLASKTDIPDRGVHQAGFWVLVGAAMPSILVETAYISNPYEERLLKTTSFQRSLADAIGASIVKFKATYEKGIE